MNVLIADLFSEAAINKLQSQGMEIVSNPELKEDSLIAAIKDFNPKVLVVRSTKVQKAMLDASSELSLVVRAGAGVNTIDVAYASEKGISVANCPGKNAVAVAELVMGLMLCLDRKIPENVAALREGKWQKKVFSKAQGIKGKTLGIVGMGNIGKEVVKRAAAFDMNIVAWSRSLDHNTATALGVSYLGSPKEVAEQSDIVSVHVALTDDTRGMCDKGFFAAMKEGAFFINASRADVVDEDALLEAMDNKGIRAGLDVFAGEPEGKMADWQTKLSVHPSIVGTHHIAASTAQATAAIGDEALRIIETYAQKGEILNCVNA